MATYFTLTERRNICPACDGVNVLVGSDLVDGMEVCCSRCGSFIGYWSEIREQLFGDRKVAPPEDAGTK